MSEFSSPEKRPEGPPVDILVDRLLRTENPEQFQEIRQKIFQLREQGFLNQGIPLSVSEAMTWPRRDLTEDSSSEDIYLELQGRRIEVLKKSHALESPPPTIISSVDLHQVLLGDIKKSEALSALHQGKFDGVAMGMTDFHDLEKARTVRKKIDSLGLAPLGFHGTTNPYWRRQAEESDYELTAKDLAAADIIDPSGRVPVNYDCYTYDLDFVERPRGKTLADIIANHNMMLRERFGTDDSLEVIKKIITFVADSGGRESTRPILFEVPGVPATTGILDVTQENLEIIKNTAQGYLKNWGITIDVGHVFTNLPWSKGLKGSAGVEKRLEEILDLLEQFKDDIKMLHLSGATSPYSLAVKKLAEVRGLDLTQVAARDFHTAVDNALLLDFIRELREKTKDHKVFEVSETRPLVIAEHLRGETNFNFSEKELDQLLVSQILQQAELLGYLKR